MDDPAFRAYMKRVPSAHPANTHGEPFQLWVETTEHRWLTRTYATYADIWPVFIKRFRDPSTHDVTITSRRVFYAPPGEWYRVKVRLPAPTLKHPAGFRIEDRWRQTFRWDGYDLNWCGRCRRPSYWMPLFSNHHALRRQPTIAPDDNYRCILCGIRWIAQPTIENMTKMERKT